MGQLARAGDALSRPTAGLTTYSSSHSKKFSF
jgi:hypothetical protein